MSTQALLALGALAAVLATTGGAWLWRLRRVRPRRRQQSWQELCLRLELVPQPGEARVARGELSGTAFFLHDTGSRWLVELSLPQPLLPPGMVLQSARAPTLPPLLNLHPLEWHTAAAVPPGVQASSALEDAASGTVEAPEAFLEQATGAMKAHAPLRVEPRRLIQQLRTGDVLPVDEARGAVRALEATARGWLQGVERHGLPRITPLAQPQPPPTVAPPAPPRRRVARELWISLALLNAGIPNIMLMLLTGCGVVLLFGVVLASMLWVVWAYFESRYGDREIGMWLLMLSTTIAAPCFFMASATEDWSLRFAALAFLFWIVPHALRLRWVLSRREP